MMKLDKTVVRMPEGVQEGQQLKQVCMIHDSRLEGLILGIESNSDLVISPISASEQTPRREPYGYD